MKPVKIKHICHNIKSVKLVSYQLHFYMVTQIDIIYLAQKVTECPLKKGVPI